MFWNLLLLQVLMTLLVDVTGVVDDMLTPVARWITGSKVGKIGKPFNCSTCMTFWTCLIYLIATGNVTLPYLCITMVLCCTTDITLALFYFLKDIIGGAVEAIENYFNL